MADEKKDEVKLLRGEFVEISESDKDKTAYYYTNPDKGIRFQTRTILKSGDKIVFHMLTNEWGKTNVVSRYDSIKRIILEGANSKLPTGFSQAPSRGYAPTDLLKPLIKFIDKNSGVEEIILSKSKSTVLVGKQLVINLKDLTVFAKNTSALKKIMSENNRVFVQNNLARRFPKHFQKTVENYQRGTLYRLLSQYDNLDKKISPDDRTAMIGLFEKLSISKTTVLKRRELILRREETEKKMIEEILSEFENLISKKRISEERWQIFFNENAWIFSQLFAYPAVLIKDKAYVGGKLFSNDEGKFVDFLYVNELTRNTALIEIKRHTTNLLQKTAYRGKNVFSMDKDLSGAISQVLDQKSTYLKDFNSIKGGENIEAFNPKCLIIAGMFSNLSNNQRSSFELLRASLKDVEIITFDELLTKIKSLLSLFKNSESERIEEITKLVKSAAKKNEKRN